MRPTIKIVDGTNVTIKSETTESIDVHLALATLVRVILPNGQITTVYDDGSIIRHDKCETLLSYTKPWEAT